MAKNKADRQAAMAENTVQDTAEVVQDTVDTADTADTATPTEGGDIVKGSKSIVPSKYAGKYKNGGSDPLAEFIKSQCVGKDGFEFSAFFQLNRINGIADEKVKHYEDQVAAKLNGANGRARMTLRNMLATIARKNGKLKNLAGEDVEVVVPKQTVSGAAAKQQAATAETAASV